MPDISFTVDLSEVRKSISSEAAPSLYHDLDYLNTNLTLPSLSNLRTRLMQKPNQPFGFFEKRKLSNDLFKSLKDWAYRNPGYGVKEAYEEYAKSRNSTSRKKFVEHCAKVTSLGEEWTHNQVEKVVAIVLRGLEGGNPPGKIKEALDDAMESYVQTSREQARKDFDRNDIVFYDGVKVLDVKEGGQTGPYQVFTRENFSSLTGEQMGFITTLCDQGKFAGGQTVPVMQDMADNKGVILTTESQTSILQKDGRTYVIRREDLSDQSMTDPAAPKVKRCTMSTIIDITDLQAESFTPGCASGKPSTKIVFGGDSDKLGELNIPKEWKSKVDVNDMDVLRGASTAQELPKSPIERVSGDAVADHEQHAVSEASHPASYAVDLVSHVSKAKTYEDAVELYNDAVNVVPKDEQFTMLGTPKTEKGITTVTWLRPGGNHDNPDDHIIYRNENGKESWVCGAGVGDVIIPPQKTSKGYALARVQNGNVSIVAGEKDAILNIKNRKDHEVAEVSDLRKAISKYVVHGVERSTNPVRRSHREDYGRAP